MIIPVGYAQCNAIFGGNGYTRGAQVVFGVQIDGAINTASGIAASVAAVLEVELMPSLATNIALQSVKAKLGPNPTGDEASVSSGQVGADVGHPLPPNVAVLVTKRTSQGGRQGRGRIFLPGVTEAQTDGAGMLTVGGLAALQVALDSVHTELGVLDLPMVLLHNDADAPLTVTELEVKQLMATQRRRIRRVGGRRTVEP